MSSEKMSNRKHEDIRLEIFRNRSEMEANITFMDTGEIVSRVPVSWKSRKGKIDYLSVSKIQSYEQCPACFYREYISEDSVGIDNANYFTVFGSIMHEVAEVITKSYMESGIVLNTVSVLDDVWKKYNMQGLDTYEQIKSLLVQYFNANPIDNRADTPVLIEEEWRGELGGCTFGLILDYAGVKKNNPKVGILRDYKTNRMPFTTADLSSSLQLRIYQIVLRRHLMPDIERWISGYDMFFHGWQQCKEFTEDELKSAEDYVANINHQILNDNIWEEKLNNYCGYRNCRFSCDTYQKALKQGLISDHQYVIDIDSTDFSEIEKEREMMMALEKNAKNRKAELDAIMKQYISHKLSNGEKPIVNNAELQLYSSSQPVYRYDDVYRVLLSANRLDLLNGFLSIKDSKAFARLCNAQDMDLRLQLAGCVSNGYSSPYITKKKI